MSLSEFTFRTKVLNEETLKEVKWVLYSHTIPLPFLLPGGYLRHHGKEFTCEDFPNHGEVNRYFTPDKMRAFRLDPQDASREDQYKRTFAIEFAKYLSFTEEEKEETEIIYDAVNMFGNYPDYVTQRTEVCSWDAICSKDQLEKVLGITDWYRTSSRFPSIKRFKATVSELKKSLKKAMISIAGLHHKMWLAVPEVGIDYEKTWSQQKFQILSMVQEDLDMGSETFDEMKDFSKTALSALDDESWDFMRDRVSKRMRDFLSPYYNFLSEKLDGKFSLQDFGVLSILTQTRFLAQPPESKALLAKSAMLRKAALPFEITRKYVQEVTSLLYSYAKFHGMDSSDEAYKAMHVSIGTASCTEAPVKEYGKSEGLRKGLDTCRRTGYLIPVRSLTTGKILHKRTFEEVKEDPLTSGFYLSIEMMLSALAEAGQPLTQKVEENGVHTKVLVETTEPPVTGVCDGEILDIEEPGKPRILLKGSVFAYLGTTPLAKGLLYLVAKDPQFTRGVCGSNHTYGHIEKCLELESTCYDRLGFLRDVVNASVDAKTATDDLDRAKAMTLVHAFGSVSFGKDDFYLNLCTRFSLLPIVTKDGIIRNTTPMGTPLSKLALTLAQASAYEWARYQSLASQGLTRFEENQERYVYGIDPEAIVDCANEVYFDTSQGAEREPKPTEVLVEVPVGIESQRLKILRSKFFGTD